MLLQASKQSILHMFNRFSALADTSPPCMQSLARPPTATSIPPYHSACWLCGKTLPNTITLQLAIHENEKSGKE